MDEELLSSFSHLWVLSGRGSVEEHVFKLFFCLRPVVNSRSEEISLGLWSLGERTSLGSIENFIKVVSLHKVEGLEPSEIFWCGFCWLLSSDDCEYASENVNNFGQIILVFSEPNPRIQILSHIIIDGLPARKLRDFLELENGHVSCVHNLPSECLPVVGLEESLLVGGLSMLDSCLWEVSRVMEFLCWSRSELLSSFVFDDTEDYFEALLVLLA